VAYGARLESALGEIPRGFKSRILRGWVGSHGFNKLAVAVGFEPTESVNPHTLSRRAP
jgi:hypothetical protein